MLKRRFVFFFSPLLAGSLVHKDQRCRLLRTPVKSVCLGHWSILIYNTILEVIPSYLSSLLNANNRAVSGFLTFYCSQGYNRNGKEAYWVISASTRWFGYIFLHWRRKWRGEICIHPSGSSVCFVSCLVNRNLWRRARPVSLSSRCPDADLEGFYSPASLAWILTVCLCVLTLSFVSL